MIDKREIYLTYNDIAIIPSSLTSINHRGECNPFLENGMLPIFTAPMSSVVNMENFNIFEENKITPILPRNYSFTERLEMAIHGKWAAFSLKEFEDAFANENHKWSGSEKIRVLIDVANGHISTIYTLVEKSKKLFGEKIEIMIGNIANPEAYNMAYMAGADYVRVGIGSGEGCITSSNTAIHCPMATLIEQTAQIKSKIKKNNATQRPLPKIIADGGIREFRDIVKALALGADCVMIGGFLSKCFDSAGKVKFKHKGEELTISPLLVEKRNDGYYYENEKIENISKVFYGMASRQGQIDMFGKKTKTSEGILKELPVTCTISQWSENFIDTLRSAMSYTNSKELKDITRAHIVQISNNAFSVINK